MYGLLEIVVTALNGFGVVGGILALIAIIAFAILFPWVAIWALNVLFPSLAIPFTFETWLAGFVLLAVFKQKSEVTVKS